MRKESFPISEENVENFIKVNKELWPEVEVNDSYIYINLSMVRLQVAWVIPKLLYAKGLQEKTGAQIVAFTWNENELFSRFLESFGIQHVALNTLCNRSKLLGMKAAKVASTLMIGNSDSNKIKELCIDDIKIGKYIYEDILRTSNISTIKNCHSKLVFKKTMHIMWALYALKKYNENHKCTHILIDDYAYHEGAVIKVFKNWGAEVIAANNWRSAIVKFDGKGEPIRIPTNSNRLCHNAIESIDKQVAISWTDKCMIERFKGKDGRSIDRGAFANKKVLAREDYVKEYGLNPDKKNVVIMAHTFTDAIYNYGEYCFRDYYDWTEQTLKIASEISDVNWILKPHPTRKAYNESQDSIEDMFKRHKKENMFFLDDNISAESIKTIADVIVTIGGNAGGEFACFGIPSVIVGHPYYKGFGYTVEPESYDAYKKCLENIAEVQNLNEKEIELAKKVFYLNFCDEGAVKKTSFKDDCAKFNNSNYMNMVNKLSVQYFDNNSGTMAYNDKMLTMWIDYISDNDIKATEYYQRGQDGK